MRRRQALNKLVKKHSSTRHKKETAKNEKNEMGAARLELAETEVDGFTVHCNCHYATPPKGLTLPPELTIGFEL